MQNPSRLAASIPSRTSVPSLSRLRAQRSRSRSPWADHDRDQHPAPRRRPLGPITIRSSTFRQRRAPETRPPAVVRLQLRRRHRIRFSPSGNTSGLEPCVSLKSRACRRVGIGVWQCEQLFRSRVSTAFEPAGPRDADLRLRPRKPALPGRRRLTISTWPASAASMSAANLRGL